MSVQQALWGSLSVVYDLGFGLFHLTFWRWLDWPQSLKNSGKLNQGVTQTLNVMLVYVLCAYGASLALVAEPGQALLALSGGGFWLLRTIVQPILFPRTRLSWRMTALLAIGAILHVATYLTSIEVGCRAQPFEGSHAQASAT